MADITMCSGNNCELSTLCYRYKAEPSKFRQSYFTSPPLYINQIGEHQCEYYIPNDKQNV